MNEMIERVANAIMKEENPDSLDQYAAMARAAIKAMRVPTERMIGEALIQPHPSVAESGGIIPQARRAALIDWRAMIDEALR